MIDIPRLVTVQPVSTLRSVTGSHVSKATLVDGVLKGDEAMSRGKFHTTIYRKRLDQLQGNLRSKGWQAALIMQPRDLYYYAGTAQPANLWVPDEGDASFTRRVHGAQEATGSIVR